MVRILPDKRKLKEGERLCRVADEPVVVLKFPPVKPGNSVEDKTEMICGKVHRDCLAAKSAGRREGGKFIRKFWNLFEWYLWRTSHLTRWASTGKLP